MGLDATRPLDADPMKFKRIRVPGEEAVDLAEAMARRLFRGARRSRVESAVVFGRRTSPLQRRTTPTSISNRSSKRPSVWSTISSSDFGCA